MSQTRQLSTVGLGHRRGQYTGLRRQKRNIAAAANSLSHLLKSPSSHGPKSIGKREERTAPHRQDHRYAGPTAIVPLQHHISSGRVEPPNPDHTPTASQSPPQKTQRAGASPHTPLDSSLSSPRQRHRTRGPRHFRHSTPSRGFVYIVATRMKNNDAPLPRSP